ncbi:MAG: 50S ribosomal protein L24 [Candidatus Blackburnbacteria bacterium]|nr:50S ribosomal protein L24 [Candidatus Blackburnbacteria bacterium]
MKLRIGDEIIITAGKDKSKKGKIEKVFPAIGKILVPGVNIYKRTRKSFGGEKGGIFEFARPLSPGNVALICPQCGKQTRVGFRVDKKGIKMRICAKCKREIVIKEGKK